MIISFEGAMGVHPLMAQLRSAQVAVEAGNIINAETPGYRARSFTIQLEQALLPMVQTNPRHMTNETGPAPREAFRNNRQPANNGNDVSLAYEQAMLASRVSGFNMSVMFMKERLSMLGQVINGEVR